jgi:hypothetical protein
MTRGALIEALQHLLQKLGNATTGTMAALITAQVIAQVVTLPRRKQMMASPQQNGTQTEAKRNLSLDNLNHPALIHALHRAPAVKNHNTARRRAAVAKCGMVTMQKPLNMALLQKRLINPAQSQPIYRVYLK